MSSKKATKFIVAAAIVLFLLVPLAFVAFQMGGTASESGGEVPMLSVSTMLSSPASVESNPIPAAHPLETPVSPISSLSVPEPKKTSFEYDIEASSPNAYVTLMHGIDESFRYRGFLYNVIVMKKLLIDKFKSSADFVLMIGFTFNEARAVAHPDIQADLDMLISHGIKVLRLSRLVPGDGEKVGFAEMALLKITPWTLTQYRRLQYLDGDVMPSESLDSYFTMKIGLFGSKTAVEELNSFSSGAASPVNSGWFLCSPSVEVYRDLRQLAVNRLTSSWDRAVGWGTPIDTYSPVLMRPWERHSVVKEWEFNGASLDQGLFLYYFVLLPQSPGVWVIPGRDATPVAEVPTIRHMLHIDVSTARLHSCKVSGSRALDYSSKTGSVAAMMRLDYEMPPMAKFVHFTGQRKPWVMIQHMYAKYAALRPPASGADITFDALVPFNNQKVPGAKKNKIVSPPDVKLINAWLREVDAAHIKWNNVDGGAGEPMTLSSRTMSLFQKFGSPLGYFAANK